MKILEIRPVRVKPDDYGATGLVDVLYERRSGFLWLGRQRVIRRATSTSGILWKWQDEHGSSQYHLSEIIKANVPELCAGETVSVQPRFNPAPA